MDKTQWNESINATDVNASVTGRDTVINSQAADTATTTVGAILGGKYTLVSKMNVSTGEADLYICTDGVDNYVAKVYRRKLAIKEEVTEKLQSIDSPYVAKVYAAGELNGYPYEVLPYYKNGSLEGKMFTYEQLKTSIIPALNEGLRVLHDNGIIHKDLKPSNIMLADNGQDVAIIDFGISSIKENGTTVILTMTGMTPEYSAPETFKNLFLSESDYYSLGITIFQLYCGHTPYAKMSQEEIEQFISVQKVPLPADMKEELKVLIHALTYPDITNRKNKANPNRRWGYEEVLKWCVGLKQPIPGETTGAAIAAGAIRPYKFLGETYVDKELLVKALAKHWNDGKKQLFRGFLSAYFKADDAEIAGFCMDAEDELATGDADIIFFQTLYKINPTMKCFLWKGTQYPDMGALGNELLDALWNNKTTVISFVEELLQKKVLSQYAICLDEADVQRINAIKAIESAYGMFKNDKRQQQRNYYMLAYILSGKRVFHIDGAEVADVQELTVYLKNVLEQSYEKFEKIVHDLISYNGTLDVQFECWLLALGKENEIEQWKKRLQR